METIGISISEFRIGTCLGCRTFVRSQARDRRRALEWDLFWYTFPLHSLLIDIPEGPSTQTGKVLGPKIHTLNGFWSLKPYFWGTWTLRAC